MNAATNAPTRFQLNWTFHASPAQVFRAWTDPGELSWFFNDTMPIPDEPIEVDLRVGGTWKLMMVVSEANRYFTGGIYREIVAGEKLVFNWGAVDGWPLLVPDKLDEAPLVSLTFRAIEDGTELVVDVELPAAFERAAREGIGASIRSGWTDTINRLVAPMARLATALAR